MDSVIPADTRPYLGFTQPAIGSALRLTCSAVKRRSKIEKKRPLSVDVVAHNVKTLRDRVYAQLPNETARNRELAKAADTSLSQVQRILSCQLAAGIDMIEALANALHVRPQELLTPYFGLGTDVSPVEPPVSQPESAPLQRRKRS